MDEVTDGMILQFVTGIRKRAMHHRFGKSHGNKSATVLLIRVGYF